jgi:hypothetical protein
VIDSGNMNHFVDQGDLECGTYWLPRENGVGYG